MCNHVRRHTPEPLEVTVLGNMPFTVIAHFVGGDVPQGGGRGEGIHAKFSKDCRVVEVGYWKRPDQVDYPLQTPSTKHPPTAAKFFSLSSNPPLLIASPLRLPSTGSCVEGGAIRRGKCFPRACRQQRWAWLQGTAVQSLHTATSTAARQPPCLEGGPSGAGDSCSWRALRRWRRAWGGYG